MTQTNLQGIIFDFNGTLLWDERFHDQAWLDFTRLHVDRNTILANIIDEIHGRTNGYILEYLMNRPLTQEEIAYYSDEKESLYQRLCLSHPDEFQLAPGASGFLDAVKDAGIPRTIATASQKNNVDFFMKHLELSRWFDSSKIVFDDSTFPGKPAPDIYTIASQKIGLTPSGCLVFEDSRPGIVAAQRAGIGKIIYVASAVSNRTIDHFPRIKDFHGLDPFTLLHAYGD